MSIQYPYMLQKLTVSPSSQDANGDYTPQTESWVNVCACRNEDGKQRKFNIEADVHLIASHLIQCPQGTLALNAGEQVKVIENDGTERLKGAVIYASKDRFHTRIWV